MADQERILYESPRSMLFISGKGKMKRLFTPFTVEVIHPVGNLSVGTKVFVDEIAESPKFIILYRVSTVWLAYRYFKLPSF